MRRLFWTTLLFLISLPGVCNAAEATPALVWIPPGAFTMGSPDTEPTRVDREGSQTRVVISQGFFMGKHEVTQGEYLAVMGINPSYFSGDLNLPVEQVSWNDAVNYCRALTTGERNAGRLESGWEYRLPTEAEWEYACRAGTATPFHYGDMLVSGMANFDGEYEYDSSVGTIGNPSGTYLSRTTVVGSYAPNAWGLYDMHGNVREWCEDFYGGSYSYIYPSGSVIDPLGEGPATPQGRMVRGGGWSDWAQSCRSAYRDILEQSFSDYGIGFRVVLAPTSPLWRQTIDGQPPTNTYGACPTKDPTKDSLIVVTHGWTPWLSNPLIPPDPTWIDSMSNSIVQYLSAHSLTNWQVRGYKWVTNSWTFQPDHALSNAKQEGRKMGTCISTQGWSHIHLIGHSAGAGLIQAASEVIKSNSPSTTVHCTFLDMFLGSDKAGVTNYGRGADWSDNYFSRDVETGSVTEGRLTNAYNIDVTQLDPHKVAAGVYWSGGTFEQCTITESAHGWPLEFYSNTITGAVSSDYHGFGFPLSKEGGNWDYATSHYMPGNGTSQVLGSADSACSQFLYNIPSEFIATRVDKFVDYIAVPVVQSASGNIQKFINASIHLFSGSPVWIAAVLSDTNAVNFVSFDAQFTSATGSQGLLTVYWDTNTIGSVDETAVRQEFQHYMLKFPNAAPNSSHVLGFRLDPFTNIQSSVLLTNIATGQAGVSQPFSLAATTNVSNGLLAYQLTGQSGFAYTLQASTNFIDWTSIAILANTNGAVSFIDPDSTNYIQRFYRVIAP